MLRPSGIYQAALLPTMLTPASYGYIDWGAPSSDVRLVAHQDLGRRLDYLGMLYAWTLNMLADQECSVVPCGFNMGCRLQSVFPPSRELSWYAVLRESCLVAIQRLTTYRSLQALL